MTRTEGHVSSNGDARRYALLEYWKRCPAKAAKHTAAGYTLDRRTGQWEQATPDPHTTGGQAAGSPDPQI